jgi:hypothetical protein
MMHNDASASLCIGVFGDLAEKFIQGPGHLFYRHPVFLSLIFLFNDEANEKGAQKIHAGW